MTPPGSPCSIHFGRGVTAATPGSVKNLYLVVSDMEAARAELTARGAEVTGPGPDPNGGSYTTLATFSDPDGNSYLLQEIKTRLPGRGLSSPDAATLTGLLKEAELHHGSYEPTAPKHHWADWYAAYIVARQQGRTPQDAATDAGAHMDAVRR
jgi:hypothetical protein